MTKSLKICHLKRSGCLEAPNDEYQGIKGIDTHQVFISGMKDGIKCGFNRHQKNLLQWNQTGQLLRPYLRTAGKLCLGRYRSLMGGVQEPSLRSS